MINRLPIHSRESSVSTPRSPFLQQTRWPVGEPVNGFTPPPRPTREPLQGRYGRLEPLTPAHALDLMTAFAADVEGRSFTYLPYGPFQNEREWQAFLAPREHSDDPWFYGIRTLQGQVVGFGSYLRIDPAAGCIEIGHLGFSPLLQATTLATESIYLMARWAFAAGYRRLEWKCDALNAASRKAAQRLGFEYEGLFRQATIVKNRNRDTAWYAIIDRDWPALESSFEAWLDPANFDADGFQRRSLASFR
jgi:RimJ/RimL family protein N-acetyltransferase